MNAFGGIIAYCNRPFSSIEEMNEKLIEQHNRVVHPGDTVYCLGDFIFKGGAQKANQILKQLNGNIILIHGYTHDKKVQDWNVSELIYNMGVIEGFGKPIVISHYPMMSWPGSHHGTYHAHGHVHSNNENCLRSNALAMDVGVDAHDYTPVNIEEFVSVMKQHKLDLERNSK